ncbi:MAG: GntR family transcriptional regulator [Candidatus Promineifilaceae bacterium]
MSLPITRTVKSSLGDNLRDDILRGDLLPGQNIRLEEIAARFDVSTTPVREALRDLEAEGLVTIFPHRGAIVTQLSAKDLRDVYDIRATLEAMATRLAVPHMTEATLTQLLSYFEQMDSHLGEVLALIKLNHAFHITLYGASDRSHLCELTGILRLRTQHYLVAFISEIGGMPQAQAEHRAIIEACERGDADGAATLIYNHVNNVGNALIDYVRRKEE